MKKIFAFILLITCMLSAFAAPKFVPPNEAFQVKMKVADNNRELLADFTIAPGYHLYQEFMHFDPTDKSIARLAKAEGPAPFVLNDGHTKTKVYEGNISFRIPIVQANNSQFSITAMYQGCSEKGICYPPVTKYFDVDLEKGTVSEVEEVASSRSEEAMVTEQKKVENILAHDNLFKIALSFFILGLLLSFTPCVLPMIPILSGIIIGHKYPIGSKKAFCLSLSYVLGMAVVYATAGYFIGVAGGHIQGALQSPWVITASSILLVILALSLFDVYDLHLPAALQHRLHELSHKQKGGTYLGVFFMGGLATLIVSPCVSAPLVGALTYIGQTGNGIIGAFALLMMGFGMGAPLILIGTSGGKLLPKAGPWMNAIKYMFGILLVAMAIWMLSRILPGPYALGLWGMLLVITSVYMHTFDTGADQGWLLFWKGIGIVMIICGTLLITGASMGESDPLKPLACLGSGKTVRKDADFTRIISHSILQQRLEQAKLAKQGVILDFYATWCTTCKTIEKNIFEDMSVRTAWAGLVLLQADVTTDNPSTRAMQDQFKVYAPPAIIFIGKDGKEVESLRVVGDISKEEFLKRLSQFNKSLR